MEKLNMTNMNTLIRKGYLLAGVMMAANMFAVNEVKASAGNTNTTQEVEGMGDQSQNSDKIIKEKDMNDFTIKEKVDPKKQSPLDKLLSLENYFNLFGTLALSGANSYFKWWDYNAGSYCKLRIGCLGWRTKKFFDTVQLDFNLNLGRGAIWLIPHIINLIMIKTKAKKENTEEKKQNEEENDAKSGSNASPWVSFLFKGILQGIVSVPLAIHISNFSIAISIDSLLWAGIGKFLFKDAHKKISKKKEEKNDNPDDSTIKESDTTSQNNDGQTGKGISGQGAAN